MSAWVGIDVGGQSLKAARVDSDGCVSAQAVRPTGDALELEGLAALCAEVVGELELANGVGLGVGVAGCVTLDGVVCGSPNLPRIAGAPLARLLGETLGRPVLIDNDAHCHAFAEAWTGAAAGANDFLLLTLGSGVGSGLVIGGRVYRGTTGFGCELGHMIFQPGGRRCGCGNHGCFEAYLSEVALRSRIGDECPALERRIGALVAERKLGHAHALFHLADGGGDSDAAELAEALAGELGTAIASVVNLLDLQLVIVGGGIAPGLLAREDSVRQSMARSLFAREEVAVRIEAAACGTLAGAIGAARMAMLAV